MKKHILILGGYGGVGKNLSENLLRHTDADLTVSGRNPEKAESVAASLRVQFPGRDIHSSPADAADKSSLLEAFKNTDLAIVTATAPDHMATIAEAALETKTDLIDILVRGDVVDKLEKYRELIVSGGRTFITQAGFHPGLPAPFIRYAKDRFDEYRTANIVMAMNALFAKPESTYEIIHEVGEGNAHILKDGKWKKANYKDAVKVKFSEEFGEKTCYPLQMRELYSLDKELGLSNMGVYSAGFNSFVDNFVFPMAMLLMMIHKGAGKKISGRLMHWGIRKYYNGKPGVEFRLMAEGMKDGKKVHYTLEASSGDPLAFTSLSVIACLKQYLDAEHAKPGLYLMGNYVYANKIITDLKQMGIQITEKPI